MLKLIKQKLAARRRAAINRRLDRVYGEMRAVTETARQLKLHAEQMEAYTLRELAKEEQKLISAAKRIDAHQTFQSIQVRNARAW